MRKTGRQPLLHLTHSLLVLGFRMVWASSYAQRRQEENLMTATPFARFVRCVPIDELVLVLSIVLNYVSRFFVLFFGSIFQLLGLARREARPSHRLPCALGALGALGAGALSACSASRQTCRTRHLQAEKASVSSLSLSVRTPPPGPALTCTGRTGRRKNFPNTWHRVRVRRLASH